MRCPQCKKIVAIGDPFMPFCSERCQLLDLGDWASEKYVISTPAPHLQNPPPETEDE